MNKEARVNLQQYAEEVPIEIRAAIKGLDSDMKVGIVVALLKHGRLTFSGMLAKFEISNSSLDLYLKSLTQAGLLHNYYEKTGSRMYSFYDVTEFCQSILRVLYDAVTKPSALPSMPEVGSSASHPIIPQSKIPTGSTNVGTKNIGTMVALEAE